MGFKVELVRPGCEPFVIREVNTFKRAKAIADHFNRSAYYGDTVTARVAEPMAKPTTEGEGAI